MKHEYKISMHRDYQLPHNPFTHAGAIPGPWILDIDQDLSCIEIEELLRAVGKIGVRYGYDRL